MESTRVEPLTLDKGGLGDASIMQIYINCCKEKFFSASLQ
jgi:hypothetical protein